MNKNRGYLDIHVLQTLPPSCVNRDDTGSPKTATYGGVVRARVSSQSWKRAVRLMFRELLEPEKMGIRTKHLPEEIANRILTLDPSADAKKLAVNVLKDAKIGVKEKDNVTDALFFASTVQLDRLAECAVKGEKDKDTLQKILKDNPSVDLALFGRMVASDPSLNFDATAQVAHSISTHEIHVEYDYFTAVDDCSPKDNAGAGHLGTVEYDSATLYRYATVNLGEISALLKEDAPEAVRCFVEAFVRSMPTGKQNTFANRTYPDLVYITIRDDQPVNLCGAFEKPVIAGKDGYMVPSEKALASYAKKVYSSFAGDPEYAYVVGDAPMFEGMGEVHPLKETMKEIEAKLAGLMKNEVK